MSHLAYEYLMNKYKYIHTMQSYIVIDTNIYNIHTYIELQITNINKYIPIYIQYT